MFIERNDLSLLEGCSVFQLQLTESVGGLLLIGKLFAFIAVTISINV